jgi:hypothetical protein
VARNCNRNHSWMRRCAASKLFAPLRNAALQCRRHTRRPVVLVAGSAGGHPSDLELVLNELRCLRGEFGSLRGEFGSLRGEFGSLRGEFGSLRGEFGSLRGELGSLCGEFGSLRDKMSNEMGAMTALLGRIVEQAADPAISGHYGNGLKPPLELGNIDAVLSILLAGRSPKVLDIARQATAGRLLENVSGSLEARAAAFLVSSWFPLVSLTRSSAHGVPCPSSTSVFAPSFAKWCRWQRTRASSCPASQRS